MEQASQPEVFQSTPPVWGETPALDDNRQAILISIHSPRVGGDTVLQDMARKYQISIHSPRVGGDAETI